MDWEREIRGEEASRSLCREQATTGDSEALPSGNLWERWPMPQSSSREVRKLGYVPTKSHAARIASCSQVLNLCPDHTGFLTKSLQRKPSVC